MRKSTTLVLVVLLILVGAMGLRNAMVANGAEAPIMANGSAPVPPTPWNGSAPVPPTPWNGSAPVPPTPWNQ